MYTEIVSKQYKIEISFCAKINWKLNSKRYKMEWYIKVLKNYAEFTGRASRKEYWMFFLFNFIISIGLTILGGVLSRIMKTDQTILSNIYSLAVLVGACDFLQRKIRIEKQ
jgi:Protein of unknown function (DUF805)